MSISRVSRLADIASDDETEGEIGDIGIGIEGYLGVTGAATGGRDPRSRSRRSSNRALADRR